ncbi:MAG: FKBP-type peptidyl-prolyl cis-trans isomerase, partial [Bacteroidales bacterium]|nr:FKBP-type peptidyl-prolyl cis-trans isomerase [Bacteroidales bacterium]
MEIQLNKVVSLSYTLEVDGDIIETVTAEKPMQFIFGTGYLLPKFEDNVKGKKVGDTFDFKLAAEDAYGNVDPEAIVELPKRVFEVDGKIQENVLFVGNVLPMMDSEGNRLNGAIDEVKEDTIVMNFNHPLAGA